MIEEDKRLLARVTSQSKHKTQESTASSRNPNCKRPENCASFDDTACVVCRPMPDVTAAEVLCEMANTFRQRSAIYKDNYKMIGKLMAILFPNGVPSELVVSEHFHNFELILVKIARFAISELKHQDSIHDIGVFCAMIEASLINNKGKNNE